MLKHIRNHYERSDPQASAVREHPHFRPTAQAGVLWRVCCASAVGAPRASPHCRASGPAPLQVVCGFGTTREQADALLDPHPAGTFLLRFGSQVRARQGQYTRQSASRVALPRASSKKARLPDRLQRGQSWPTRAGARQRPGLPAHPPTLPFWHCRAAS